MYYCWRCYHASLLAVLFSAVDVFFMIFNELCAFTKHECKFESAYGRFKLKCASTAFVARLIPYYREYFKYFGKLLLPRPCPVSNAKRNRTARCLDRDCGMPIIIKTFRIIFSPISIAIKAEKWSGISNWE